MPCHALLSFVIYQRFTRPYTSLLCFRRSNCTDCLSGPKDGGAWCTTLNKCVSLSEYSLDYSYGECLHFQAYPTHYQSQSTTTTQYVLERSEYELVMFGTDAGRHFILQFAIA